MEIKETLLYSWREETKNKNKEKEKGRERERKKEETKGEQREKANQDTRWGVSLRLNKSHHHHIYLQMILGGHSGWEGMLCEYFQMWLSLWRTNHITQILSNLKFWIRGFLK